MELTPNDVEQKAFTQALRGYQMDEVDDFLDEIVTSLRAYDQRLRDAQEKIRALETEASNRGGDETTISRAILVAQRSADSLLAEAKVEAEEIRHTAKAEIQLLSQEREEERNRIRGQIDGMRDRVSGLRATLATLASAIGGQVDEMDAEIADSSAAIQPDPSDVAADATAATNDQGEPSATGDPSDQPAPEEVPPENARSDGESEREPEDGSPNLDPGEDRDDGPDNDEPDNDRPDNDGPDNDGPVGEGEIPARVSARPWERG